MDPRVARFHSEFRDVLTVHLFLDINVVQARLVEFQLSTQFTIVVILPH